ncbi:MAG: hypothetical protein ACOYJJ_03520 [Anaerovoracaceae bacterium]|jgi:hypothetical protein
MLEALKVIRWFCLVFGAAIFIFTRDGFGTAAATCLGVFFAFWFWRICQRERKLEIHLEIARMCREAVSSAGGADNLIEIQKVRSRLVARIYVIDAGSGQDRLLMRIQRSLQEALRGNGIRKYLWAIQMTGVNAADDYARVRKQLDESLSQAASRFDKK